MFAAKRSSSTSSSRRHRLDRRNANKHIDYDATTSSDDSPALRSSHSLDLPGAYSRQTSFRIEGYDGEVDQLYRDLGLSGPDDFAIPAAAWAAARKSLVLNSADQSPRRLIVDEEKDPPPPMASSDEITDDSIKDSVLSPPPFTSVLASEMMESTWDLVRSLAPEAELGDGGVVKRSCFDSEEEVEEEEMGSGSVEVRLGETIRDFAGSSLVSTSSGYGPSSTAKDLLLRIVSSREIADDSIKDSVLRPPPFTSALASEMMESTWDLVRSFAPEAELGDGGVVKGSYLDSEEEVEEEEEMGSGSVEVRLGETIRDFAGSSLVSTSSGYGPSSTAKDLLRMVSSREIADDSIKDLVLRPPPFTSVLASEMMESTWDLVRSFAPEAELGDGGVVKRSYFDSEEEVEEEEMGGGGVEVRLGETIRDLAGSSSVSTLNGCDPSRTTEVKMFVVSPNGRFKRNITSWMRGHLLGSGSFGTVFEGISDDGFFFAVKEVSLLDQGNNAKQCILQLEQEIVLLSQFEHDNIVQYVGTDKEEAKLFIFLELATQGSLASLYQKYHLQDSQVSAYTRQILNGLSYLHDRNVVHRDIKCANILVDSHGTVKLADFGLAKEITKLDVLKSCKGSVYWMAPEVVNPKRAYGPAADIWSLGCTVLEMLTRQLPYPKLEWTHAFFKIGRGEPPPLPKTLSPDARDFIQRCVQVNPDHRPTASQLSEHQFVRRSMSASTSPNNSFRNGNGYG
ncbi:putative mitogen-activated protein kinase kinase kinase STE-STE11 family [Dioscorea sansibarensis]